MTPNSLREKPHLLATRDEPSLRRDGPSGSTDQSRALDSPIQQPPPVPLHTVRASGWDHRSFSCPRRYAPRVGMCRYTLLPCPTKLSATTSLIGSRRSR